jgi:uncharacterized RDD family membrane protein YckC
VSTPPQPAPGVSPVAGSGLPVQAYAYPTYPTYPPLAEPWPRALAFVIDGVVGLAFALLFMNVWGVVMVVAAGIAPEDWTAVLVLLLGYAAMFAFGLGVSLVIYVWWPSTHHGATLGKQVVGLRAIRLNGTPVPALGHLARFAGLYVDGLVYYLPGLIMVLNRPDRRRLGDLFAGTVVVRTR